MGEFIYEKPFQHGKDETEYRRITADHVRMTECCGRKMLQVQPEALRMLAKQAFIDVNFYMRTSHLE